MAEIGANDAEYGVLLYYKYASIPDFHHLVQFYESSCRALDLLGRVRLASQGVNVTVGGKLSALKSHIEEVKSICLFEGTDFKLASCHQPANDKVAKDCGFTSLSIRIVKELVTLTSHPLLNPPNVSNAGKHLSAHEFHSILHKAVEPSDAESTDLAKKVVLLDARNLYETRIGKFDTPNVETVDPEIRQYSDLPTWIDQNSDKLKGHHVLMYCTGGIRCEMASAYIKSKGAGFENVYQLYGGIQRYLEQFPDGGFFKGKNFVFDHRIAVGSSNNIIMGSCLLCGSSYDDYSARCRCTYCRMLVLVCDKCQIQRKKTDSYVCELCEKHGKLSASAPPIENKNVASVREFQSISTSDILPSLCNTLRDMVVPQRKLKVLCLHGFRQNASGFKGRTASLAKKLKNTVELVFVDAPHELSFFYRPSKTETLQSSLSEPGLPQWDKCKKKYAWLVSPSTSKKSEVGWVVADGPFDPLQYEQQTEGLDVSIAYLKSVFSQQGPFDGVLGFSQGAAMAAFLCAQREILSEIDFRFAIMCSGFRVQLSLSDVKPGSINCPSLHIYGSDQGKDRQIAKQMSKDLADLFEEGCSEIIQHDSGHIIPTRSPYIDQIKSFLRRF